MWGIFVIVGIVVGFCWILRPIKAEKKVYPSNCVYGVDYGIDKAIIKKYSKK